MSDTFPDDRYGDDLMQDKPKKSGRTLFLPLILFGGLVTTLGTLVLIFVLSMYFGTAILSFVANLVFPLGALGAGLIAGSGYAITARLLQYKPSAAFIVFICLLQFGLFFVGRYLEYVPHRLVVDQPLSFGEYYRQQIEESEWTSKDSKEPYKMGKLGWLLELWTAVCFSLTSLVWIGVLSTSAYCSDCRRFMSQGLEFVFPARAPTRKIKKKDTEALEAFQKEDHDAFVHAMTYVSRIVDFLKTDQAKNRGDVYQFLCKLRDEIGSDASKLKGVPNTVRIRLSGCKECDNYQLIAALEVADINNKSAMKALELVRYIDGDFAALALSELETVPAEDT